jgi:hypothetical protein
MSSRPSCLERAVDLTRQIGFEQADRFAGALALRLLSESIVPRTLPVQAQPGQYGQIEHMIKTTIPPRVDTDPYGLATTTADRGNTAVAGEVMLGREAANVTDLGNRCGGHHVADT